MGWTVDCFPRRIRVWSVLHLVETNLAPIQCTDEGAGVAGLLLLEGQRETRLFVTLCQIRRVAKISFASIYYICHQNEGMAIRKEKWLPLF